MPVKIGLSLFIFCWIWFAEVVLAQTTVGMGTANPNPNAVLELVSENLDQGFLVPRFTTAQRTASGFTGKLSSKDNGLLVFDIDEGEFYYWYNEAWEQGIGAGSLEGAGTVWYTGNAAPHNNEGKNGDFYIHTLSGDVYRKQNGVFNVIGNMLPSQNQYIAGTGIGIGADNTIINTGDLSHTNEIQDLQLSGDELKITKNTEAATIDLSAYKNNDTNELIQGVSLTGETLKISDAGGEYDVDLSSLKLSLADNDPTNEIQDLELIFHQLHITSNPAATSVDLSTYLDNTDAQMLSLTGTDLSISGGNTIDLSSLQDDIDDQNLGSSKTGNDVTVTIEDGSSTTFSIADDDNSTTNEIQDLQLVSHQLSITNNAGATNLDLSPYLDNTDDQNLGSSKTGNDVTVTIEDGSSTTFNIADDDNSTSNETITDVSLQPGEILRIREGGVNHNVDLSSLGGGISIIGDPANISDFDLLGNTLRITEEGVDYDVDMSSFQRTTLNHGNILVGNASNVATPVTISGDLTLNNDGTMTIKLDAVTTAKIINDAVDKDKIHANVAGAGLGQNADGSLEIKTTGGLQIAADQLSLTNTGNGQILIGNGSTVNAQIISGDATLANDGTATVTGLQGRPVAATAPASGNLLTWNGTAWEPQAPSGGAGSGAAWYSGNNIPNAGNPAGAVDSDYFYRNNTETVYRKVGVNWVEQGKWFKPSGSSVQGASVSEITTPALYIGAGDPSDGPTNNGKPGDLYYDTDEDKLYIKKNSTQWNSF